jgi:hypothetical protein
LRDERDGEGRQEKKFMQFRDAAVANSQQSTVRNQQLIRDVQLHVVADLAK